MENIEIGSRVRLLSDIYEHADDHSPGGYLARCGEELIVRGFGKHFPFYVSHSHITDNSFGVQRSEFALIEKD